MTPVHRRQMLARTSAWAATLSGMTPWLVGCDKAPSAPNAEPAGDGAGGGAGGGAMSSNKSIDVAWHRADLMDNLLARWAKLPQDPGGHFVTEVDRHWKAVDDASHDLTMQSRMVFSFIHGHEVNQDPHLLTMAKAGADQLLTRYRDDEQGGYYQRVDAQGKVLSDRKVLYAHAFLILALSHMTRVTKDPKYVSAALLAWRDVRRKLREPSGGFRPEAARDFTPAASLRNQNPLMHLFEALLALARISKDPSAEEGLNALGQFVLKKLMQDLGPQGARIPEWYDDQWQALSTREKGGYIDLGHQFEWVHLMASAEEQGLPAEYGQASRKLLQFALEKGYDETDGGAFAKQYPEGQIERDKHWWQQAECLRALLISAQRDDKRELWRRCEQTAAFIKDNFVDATDGGWTTSQRRACSTGGCQNLQPEPYHMTGMHMTALRLAHALPIKIKAG